MVLPVGLADRQIVDGSTTSRDAGLREKRAIDREHSCCFNRGQATIWVRETPLTRALNAASAVGLRSLCKLRFQPSQIRPSAQARKSRRFQVTIVEALAAIPAAAT